MVRSVCSRYNLLVPGGTACPDSYTWCIFIILI